MPAYYQPYGGGGGRSSRLSGPVGPWRDGTSQVQLSRPRWQGNQYPFVGVSNCEGACTECSECGEGECSEGDSDMYGSVEDSVLLHGYSDRVTPCVKG